jgi:Protein kinase domain
MIGTRLSQYQITASLGAGAMGEVFRARDARLNRDVAIKLLPKGFASDVDRLRRFELEAKTLAALNHPNILTIYDTGPSLHFFRIIASLGAGGMGKVFREVWQPRLVDIKTSLRLGFDA